MWPEKTPCGDMKNSTVSFSSITLQPIPRFFGPLFGPLTSDIFFGPLDRPTCLSASSSGHFHQSFSQTLALRRHRRLRPRLTASSLLHGAAKAIAQTISAASKLRSKTSHIKKSKEPDDSKAAETTHPSSGDSTTNPSSGMSGLTTHPSSSSDQMSVDDSETSSSEAPTSNLQWAQGKAGEDRVHVVVSEEHVRPAMSTGLLRPWIVHVRS